jgi:RNA polymerase sigma-70 factor (ECF subfamily)
MTESRSIKAAQEISDLAERRDFFLRLVDPYVEVLYRTALHMTGSADRAEDALQELYLKAWRALDTYDRTRDAKVWLFAILRHVIFDATRRRKREIAAQSLDEVGPDTVQAAGESPAAELTRREVLEAIEKLPAEFRMVVLLVVVEELSYRDVAEALAIPEGTVMSRLHRGRQILQYHLRAHARERPAAPPLRLRRGARAA